MVKKGDTLVEVTIAIGIFSMIAIGVASVMSSGSSGSQTALETTLAREEIDVQAEALRFIHSARISSRSDSDNPYDTIWNAITASAIDGGTMDASTAQFNPSSCQALYNRENDNSVFAQHAFILNPRALDSSQNGLFQASEASDASVFTPTTTHPRLVFDASGDNLRAEGIYVIAVKDAGTNIVGYDSAEPAFYDFYIRTCWYGSDNERPSTISTVIRLYSPPAVASQTTIPEKAKEEINIYYCNNPNYPGRCQISENAKDPCRQSGLGTCDRQIIDRTGDDPIYKLATIEDHVRFRYWQDLANGITRRSDSGTGQVITESQAKNSPASEWVFVANWDTNHTNKLIYDSNGGSRLPNNTRECKAFEPCDLAEREGFTFTIDTSLQPTRDGYDFLGWAGSATATYPTYNTGVTHTVYRRSLKLYAVWRPRYIQNFSVESCKEKAQDNNAQYSLVDRRDNQVYFVRYSHNECWMASDLNTRDTIPSSYSNFTSSGSINIGISDSKSYTLPYRSGLLYNFCAATAIDSYGCSKTAEYTGTTDICPSGWRLPNGAEMAAVRQDKYVFPKSIGSGSWWTTTSLGQADNGSGILMCLLTKSSNSDSFTFAQGFSRCDQRDSNGSYWGYNRLNVARIRCVHK